MFKKIVQKYNLSIILIPLAAIICVGSILMIFNKEASLFIDNQMKNMIDNFSWYYLLIGFVFVVILVWLAFGKYGKVKLGNADDKPKYSNFAWSAMIFTSTMAADVIYYSFHNWMTYYNSSDILGNGSIESAVQAAQIYPLFHWGPTPWSFYLLPAVAYAYMAFRKNKPINKISEAIECNNKLIRNIVDVFSVFCMLVAVSVTLAISTPMIPACISELFGIKSSNILSISVLLGISVMFIFASMFNRRGGIEKLAKINVIGYVLLFIIFLFTPNFVFILESTLSGVGGLIHNFIPLSLSADPGRFMNGFVQNETVFFWAYWIAWAIIVPMFIGKISKGRTIKNVVIGGMISGVCSTFVSFSIFGGYGLAEQISGAIDPAGVLAESGDVVNSILMIINSFPSIMPQIILVITAITMMIENATTLDSLIVVSAEASYRNIREPSKRMYSYWSILFIILPIIFIFNQNKLLSLQTIMIVMALPMSFILLRVVYVFLKHLIRHHR